MDEIMAAGIRWDFEGKYRRMDEMVDTSVHLLYKWSSFETDEEKAKHDLTKQLLGFFG